LDPWYHISQHHHNNNNILTLYKTLKPHILCYLLAAEDVTERHTQHVAYEPAEASVGFANRLTQLVEHQQQQQQHQQQQQQQQHILSQVVRTSDNKFVTLADGGKVIDIISMYPRGTWYVGRGSYTGDFDR
jgi:hypothetical protein